MLGAGCLRALADLAGAAGRSMARPWLVGHLGSELENRISLSLSLCPSTQSINKPISIEEEARTRTQQGDQGVSQQARVSLNNNKVRP